MSTKKDEQPFPALGKADSAAQKQSLKKTATGLPRISQKLLAKVDQSLAERFPVLPFDASDEEENLRAAEIERRREIPGKEYVFWEGEVDGRQTTKSRWIADEDLELAKSAIQSSPRSARKVASSSVGKFELPERSGSRPIKPTRKRPQKPKSERSGSRFNLPEIQNVQWEWNERGGAEAYYVPNGAVKRSEKTYLVYIGLRKLAKWQQVSQAELDRNVLAAVEKVRSEKNV